MKKYQMKDLEQVLKNQLGVNQKFIIEIEDEKVYLYSPDGFNRKEIELLYSDEEYKKLKK